MNKDKIEDFVKKYGDTRRVHLLKIALAIKELNPLELDILHHYLGLKTRTDDYRCEINVFKGKR